MTVAERIDRVIQPVVDALMFALMRATGWPRSLIRFRLILWLAVPLDAIGCAFVRPLELGLGLMLSGVVVVRWASRRDLARDEWAERRGQSERPRSSRWFSLVVIGICGTFAATSTWPWGFWVVREIVDLFVEYARATPPNPPAKARLVFAREGGR